MIIQSAKYIISAMRPDQYPKMGLPEIAFVGRSNVGKSSLMNCILNRKNLAKTSSRPGKTQTINFFDINQKFYVVDLPGYGFAKVPVAVKENWGRVMTSYLSNREPLRMAMVLVDARHKPTDLDMDMLALLDDAEVPTLVVATKVDKLKRTERKRNMDRIRLALELDEDAEILPFSSETGEGKKELWEIISDFL
ncbi:MAG: YihA family ribosome biogenesis GTP-binding protein [Candidatus Hydrogenedentota bacterium]|nr:MAG: YihA family ribosome biogenesis GTP-binding protein [Candidatus Hydrogenedentota bacterium]